MANEWDKIGRTELTVNADSITVSCLPSRSNLYVEFDKIGACSADFFLTFNGDTCANYARGNSFQGGVYAESTCQTKIDLHQGAGSDPRQIIFEVVNFTTSAKLVTSHMATGGGCGECTAPGRGEGFGKWSNTACDITSITITDSTGGSDYLSGTTLTVWGADD